MSLKIEKGIEITGRRRKKIKETEELLSALSMANHGESVFVPNSFMYRSTIIKRVFPQFNKKYKRWSLEIRSWSDKDKKGNRIWVFQNSQL